MVRSVPPVLFALLVVMLARPATLNSAPPADDMATAASAFLASLTPDQRTQAAFAFDDEERFDFHYIPRARRGVPLKALGATQRQSAHALVQTGLSQRGYAAATAIIELEKVLAALEGRPEMRDPELYYVSIFGTPAGDGPWGWRFEGHHLSLNFTIVDGQPVAWAPSFFGANPARHDEGGQMVSPLDAEQDAARELVGLLDEAQVKAATIAAEAPREIATAAERRIDPLAPAGLAAREMTSSQRRQLERLFDVYLQRVAPDLAKARLAALQEAGLDNVTLGIAGTFEVGQPHYYRVQGPTFLIEYDNTQNDANHIHSVWRDFNGDFGRDLLGEHYAAYAH